MYTISATTRHHHRALQVDDILYLRPPTMDFILGFGFLRAFFFLIIVMPFSRTLACIIALLIGLLDSKVGLRYTALLKPSDKGNVEEVSIFSTANEYKKLKQLIDKNHMIETQD